MNFLFTPSRAELEQGPGPPHLVTFEETRKQEVCSRYDIEKDVINYCKTVFRIVTQLS